MLFISIELASVELLMPLQICSHTLALLTDINGCDENDCDEIGHVSIEFIRDTFTAKNEKVAMIRVCVSP